ncbi:hypothetical protein HPB48_015851 [Haemaphysalis longicornis]|uniref:Sulfotransferase domain-containing protein n=1 Tax=Haemaphysalis longicornis TaxID=44386 RepID=A0A9J6H1Q4_HAELO|nr:hypothetical protein HPB48_015851 [Haemaphysalis longicornis]
MTGAEGALMMKRPGTIKTHFLFSMIPWSSEAKYIYVCRNPKDCVTSFFYHTRGFSGYRFQRGTFSTFFELFFDGQTDSGDYFDNVLGWYEHRNDPNVLFLSLRRHEGRATRERPQDRQVSGTVVLRQADRGLFILGERSAVVSFT